MKKWFSCLLSFLVLLPMLAFISPMSVNATNITNPASDCSYNSTGVQLAFADLHTRMPNWWSTYKYSVACENGADGNIQIRLFSTATDVVRIWALFSTLNTWTLEKWGSTTRYYYIYYHANGVYQATSNSTATLALNVTNKMMFSNITTYKKLVDGTYQEYGSVDPIPASWLPGYVPPPANNDVTTDYSNDLQAWWGDMIEALGNSIKSGFSSVLNAALTAFGIDSLVYTVQQLGQQFPEFFTTQWLNWDELMFVLTDVPVTLSRMWKAITDPLSVEAGYFGMIIKAQFSDLQESLDNTLDAVQSIPLIGDILGLVIAINNLILKGGLALAQFVFNFVGDTITFMAFVFNTVISSFIPSLVSMVSNIGGLVSYLPAPLNSSASSIITIAVSITSLGLVKSVIGILKV